MLSLAWQVAQSASLFDGGVKSWGLWQLVHAVPPRERRRPMRATLPWQLVHGLAMAFTSPECGSWQVMHAVLSVVACDIDLRVAAAQEAAAAPGSCGAWQLVQTACAGTLAAKSVCFARGSRHTRSRRRRRRAACGNRCRSRGPPASYGSQRNQRRGLLVACAGTPRARRRRRVGLVAVAAARWIPTWRSVLGGQLVWQLAQPWQTTRRIAVGDCGTCTQSVVAVCVRFDRREAPLGLLRGS